MGEERCKSRAFVHLGGFVSLWTRALLIFFFAERRKRHLFKAHPRETCPKPRASSNFKGSLPNRLELLKIVRCPRPRRLELFLNFAFQDLQKGHFPRVFQRAYAKNLELSPKTPSQRENCLELSKISHSQPFLEPFTRAQKWAKSLGLSAKRRFLDGFGRPRRIPKLRFRLGFRWETTF